MKLASLCTGTSYDVNNLTTKNSIYYLFAVFISVMSFVEVDRATVIVLHAAFLAANRAKKAKSN